MTLKVEKTASTGFCFGVRRAIEILEKIIRERGKVETLGDVVHNPQVMKRLAETGVSVAHNVEEISGDTIAVSAHGVGPRMEEEIRSRGIEIIDCTCPFVRRAQVAARTLSEAGHYVIVYGDAGHQEVRGILGWAGGKGTATLDTDISKLGDLPRKIGVLSQTTQIPTGFTEFVKSLIDRTLVKDAEIRIIDTICHDIRKRQQEALELAGKVDLMLVIGSHTSANTNHLSALCATATETYQVETADAILPAWFEGHTHVGLTSGTSASEETIEEVRTRLSSL